METGEAPPQISIHTTRKVVTNHKLDKYGSVIISIHTTRKVVTTSALSFTCILPYFNPHHPQGGDYGLSSNILMVSISIHTTRKVVTNITDIEAQIVLNFNPHHPQGGDG